MKPGTKKLMRMEKFQIRRCARKILSWKTKWGKVIRCDKILNWKMDEKTLLGLINLKLENGTEKF